MRKFLAVLFIGSFPVITSSCKESKTIVFQRPANYQELGTIIIQYIRSDDYAVLKELWPDEKTCRSWTVICDSASVEYHMGEELQKMIGYRNSIEKMIKVQLKQIPDLEKAELRSVHYKNTNKCPKLFRTHGEVEITFTTGNGEYTMYCAHAGETRDERIYLMDSLLLRKATL